MEADREECAAGRRDGQHGGTDPDSPEPEEGTAPVPARPLRFDILTLFPEALTAWLDLSILKRARDRGLVDVRAVDIRDFTTDRHRTADDTLFGGGPGMLLKLAPLAAAVDHCVADGAAARTRSPRVILLSPQGARLRQSMLEELAGEEQILLICGRYEGVDERARDLFITDEISIGDFVITGGELAAAMVIDGVTRLLPGVLGKDESSHDESFTSGLLEYPQYTRPAVFQGLAAPSVLTGGNHQEAQKWRQRQAILRTAALRPDLLPEDWRERLDPPRKKPRRRGKGTPGNTEEGK